jgi:hypothetical protein
MSMQHTHFTDIAAPAFNPRLADEKARKRLGLYDTKLRDHHVALRGRFQNHGAEHLSDAEMLELLLLHASPRKDTRPTAKKVLSKRACSGYSTPRSAHRRQRDPRFETGVQRVKALGESAYRTSPFDL